MKSKFTPEESFDYDPPSNWIQSVYNIQFTVEIESVLQSKRVPNTTTGLGPDEMIGF